MNGQALDWTGIIGLLVIAGVFGGGMWGNNGYNIENRFIERDIFNTNSNVLTSACSTQKEVLENKYALGSQIQENRFNNAIQTTELTGVINANQISANAMMQNCCCELKTAIHAEGEATRALIQANTIQELRDKVADKDRESLATGLSYGNTITANNTEERILAKLGRYVPYAGYNPYYNGTTYGTTIA